MSTMGNRFSFQKGWAQVKQGDAREVRKKLMEVLCIKTNVSFYERLRGEIEPRISEHEAIEGVFSEYGITGIWGRDEDAN